jgi:hypothetical protein
MENGPMTEQAGVIKGVAVLDLTTYGAEAIGRIKRIEGVALILVPESLAGALADIAMEGVAQVIPVPDGARVRLHTGVLTMDGDALASPGTEADVLVLTGVLVLTSPVARVGFHSTVVTGVLVAPRGSEAALAAGLTRLTGVVAYYDYTDGQKVKVFQGGTRLRGETLANTAGQPTDIAIMAGQVVVTSPLRTLGYQQVVVAGQLAAPEASLDVLEPALNVTGQVAWYTGTARAFSGSERFERGFFELLEEPITLVLSGGFEIAPDVPAELLREKVGGIVLSGSLKGSKEVVPVLQLLTVEKQGKIGPLDDEA